MMNNKKKESASLRFLYNTVLGRMILKPLTAPAVSKLCGRFLDSRLSKCMIDRFVKKNGIDLSEYQSESYSCFNDFFTRKIIREKRPISNIGTDLVSPCDGLLTAYRIKDDTVIPVKQSRYSINSLLSGANIADRYKNGICLVFRLCVNHYHRYCYIDDAEKEDNVFIKGKLHTVRPIALETYPVFVRNCREYTVMHTENFGDVTQIEVGALLVGKIKNHHGAGRVKRGQEKGLFLYGGSTVILLLEENKADISDDIWKESLNGNEIPVKQGQVIGRSKNNGSKK